MAHIPHDGIPELTEFRVRGIHFDLKGEEPWPLEKLLELGGYFQYRDIKNRLGLPEGRLKRFLTETAFPDGVLYNMRLSDKEGGRVNVYVNLPKFVPILKSRIFGVPSAGTSARHPDGWIR